MKPYKSDDEAAARYEQAVDDPAYQWMKDSIDLPQRQAQGRIARENETYRRQQARLKREHRKDMLFVLGLLLVGVVFFTWQAWRAGR